MIETSAGAFARPSLYLGARGLVFAWAGGLGPMIARYESWSREVPSMVRGLGHPGAGLPVTPHFFVTKDGIVAFWCEDDGAWSCRLSFDDEQSPPILVLPDVDRIAAADVRGGARLFGADGQGLVSRTLDARGESSGEVVRHIVEERPSARLSATTIRDEALLVAFHPGETEWSVVSTRGSEQTTVRHRHRAAIEDVRVRSVGGRAAVLLTTTAGIEIAFVGAGGKVIERPHAVFPKATARLVDPDAVFSDDHWVVLARDELSDSIWAHPLADKGVSFNLPLCTGPFAVTYRSQTYYALEVEPDGDAAELRLWRCNKAGAQQQRRVDAVVSPGAAQLRQRRDVRHALGALAERMAHNRGYRDHIARPELARDGTAMALLDARGRISLSVHPDEDSDALALRVASALGDDPELPEAPSSLVRLAQWVRARFSQETQRTVAERVAWGGQLAAEIGARIVAVDHAGNTVVLRLLIDELPPPEVFQRWLRRIRDEQPDAP